MGIKVIKEVSKKELEDWIYKINLNDPNIYDELRNPNMIGIFQLSGNTAKRLKDDIDPNNFEEMNAVNAMSRPGPMENAPLYIAQKQGAEPIYPEIVNNLLKDTYGVCLYQEQIMDIFHIIGGFTLEEANEIRDLMKKLGKAEQKPEDLKLWDKAVKKFTKSAVKNGIDDETAKKLANDLISFSSYSFNKSHSTSYAYIAAVTLYLSYYFRKYFYASLLSDESDYTLLDMLLKSKVQGFSVLPPNVNKSGIFFTAGAEKEILFGLSNIKFVSPNAAQRIIDGRPYSSLIDFIVKTRDRTITSAVIKALISVGAFDFQDKNRKKLLFVFNKFWERRKNTKIEEKLIGVYREAEKEADRIPELRDTASELAEYERKYFGFKFFVTLFTPSKIKAFEKMVKMKLIKPTLKEVSERSVKVPIAINSIRRFKDKNENEMAFIEIEDVAGNIERIPIFHSYYQFIGEQLIENNLYLLNLYESDDEKIMFGQSGWMNNEFKINRMIRKL